MHGKETTEDIEGNPVGCAGEGIERSKLNLIGEKVY